MTTHWQLGNRNLFKYFRSKYYVRKLKKELVLQLLQNFNDNILPYLPAETKAYADPKHTDYGTLGPAMQFYITYQSYLKDAFLEDASPQELATYAFIEKIK